MLWFALAVMTGLAVLAALWPLAFRRAPGADDGREAAFYRAQLSEIDRDVDRGQLPPDEAAAARAEAARRLIAASAVAAPNLAAGSSAGRRRAAAIGILVAIPIVALGLYARFGRPDAPDAPLAARKADSASPEAMDAAIAKIEAHLAASPDDKRGWSVLAPVYMRLGRFDDAVGAYRQWLRLEGENGQLRADLGEALVAAADGIVTTEARETFDRAIVDTPGLPMARFYLALAAEQDGDTKKATQIYQSLLPEAKGRAPWMIGLRARLAALQGEAPAATEAPQAPSGSGGFSPDQQEMIKGMVERLATRLAQSGGSAEEWARLIRAYSVLHETDKVKDALASARKALGQDATIDALARELGIGE
jgi:cytochrome c-type biogenesis protein CcmH